MVMALPVTPVFRFSETPTSPDRSLGGVIFLEPVCRHNGEVQQIDSAIVMNIAGEPYKSRLVPGVLAGIGIQDDFLGLGNSELAVIGIKLQCVRTGLGHRNRRIGGKRITELRRII